jgi:hypothetical protein
MNECNQLLRLTQKLMLNKGTLFVLGFKMSIIILSFDFLNYQDIPY